MVSSKLNNILYIIMQYATWWATLFGERPTRKSSSAPDGEHHLTNPVPGCHCLDHETDSIRQA